MVVASLTSSITSFVANHGVYAVFLLMAIDAVFPAASELVMVYAGALASGAFPGEHVTLFGTTLSSGAGAYLVMVLAGTLGYLVGAVIGWWIGFRGGRPLLERRGKWLHLSVEKLDRAERWFDRWEGWAVFLGRVTPVVRSFISVPAGVFEGAFRPYVWLTLLGSAIWCFAFAGAGWAAGANWEQFHEAFRYVEYVIAFGVIVVAAAVVWRYLRRRRGTADEPV